MSQSSLHSPLSLESMQLRNRIALAPMAGLTDVPFRTLAWRFGVGHMVSEMVASKLDLWHTQKSQLRREALPCAAPTAVQMAGNEPAVMAETARRLVDEGAELIDINFGCPAKKVCRRAAGSALLGDLDRVAAIVETVATAVAVPVTIKTRTGLVVDDRIGAAAVRAAEEAGARMVVMHGRSRACKFAGAVRFAAVAEASRDLSIPVLANGDIDDAQSAVQALEQSGADGIMIGRGAIGQPWIFQELAGAGTPTLAQRLHIMCEHLDHMHRFYGLQQGVRIARKHIQAYLQRLDAAALVPEFMRLDTAFAQVAWLSALTEATILEQQQRVKAKPPLAVNSLSC